MEHNKYVFISYSSNELEIATKVCNFLEVNGIPCWIAPRNIDAGINYASQIVSAIKQCEVLVLLASENTNASDHVGNEVSIAFDNKKIIIPFKLQDFKFTDEYLYFLGRKHWIEAYENIEMSMSELRDTILSLVNAEPTSDFTPTPNKKLNIKKYWVFIIPAFLLFSIVLGIFFGNYTSFKADKDVYHITLTKSSSFTDEDYSILEERVKIFSDGKKYSIDINDEEIELYLPAAAFYDKDIEYVLDAYLTRAIKLYAYDFEKKDNSEAIFIDRDDIESVSVLDGPMPGIINESQYGIDSSEYKYFSVVLTDEFVNQNKESLSEFGNNFAFAQDIKNGSYYTYYTFSQSDGKTFYILNNDISENFVNLLEYNLTHKNLSDDLNDYVIDINSKTVWQDVSSINNPGINQCNSNSFKEGTITFSLSSYSVLSEGKGIDTENALKKKLDVLGNKYAFGLYDTDKKTVYVIKTTINNINVPVMKLLACTHSYNIKGGLCQYDMSSDNIAITTSSNGNKISFLQNYYSDYEKERVSSFVESLENSDDSKIYVKIDDMPLLCTDISNIDVNTGTISFDQICQVNNGEVVCSNIDDSFLYLLDLFKINIETDYMESLSFDNYQFNVSRRGKLLTDNDFNLKYNYYNREIADKIIEIYPNAKIKVHDSELYISLNLPVDDNLVSSSIKSVKNVYNSIDFENSIYSTIAIYLIDEDNSVKERGRIFFGKNYSRYNWYWDGCIYIHGIFTNGRLEEYKKDFKAAVDNDEFINSFKQSEYLSSPWTYSMN
ncbi:MAG: toll/interleukin-1 receptor domain-containing protein [Faecalibacterium sp.]|nr:toll/interleukin-1 receptor domain-containing protein [Ruminococcus sp.]MCM1392471.1 toll/interleukin-1 receptor domain-containing protein [Ruminococcus sp.]MCM1486204.1 toll/interleukin-1 receptor domain-containing protein [Faecalibacterium sp.]